MTQQDHHCEKWDKLMNYPDTRGFVIFNDGELEPVSDDYTHGDSVSKDLWFVYCPYCMQPFELNQSQTQILQQKKDEMFITKDMVKNINKYIDELFNQNGNT